MFCKHCNTVKPGYLELHGTRKIYKKSEDSRLRIKIYLKNKWFGTTESLWHIMVFRISVFIKYQTATVYRLIILSDSIWVSSHYA